MYKIKKTTLILSSFLLFLSPVLGADPEPAPIPRQPGVLRVVCFGDSITGDRPGKPYLHLYSKWSDLIGMALELDLGVGKAEVFNMGYAGDSTFQSGDRPGAVNRVESNILAQKPDIAIILIGGNNYGNRAKSMEEKNTKFKEDLSNIVQKVKAAGIKILLVQYAEPKAADMSKVWTHLNAGNPIIAEVAKAQQVATVELAPAFVAAEKTHPMEALRNPSDGVHLQPYGEIVVARTIMEKLKQLGWVDARAP